MKKKYSCKLDVCISDNNSLDSTQEVIASSKILFEFNDWKNKENIGFSGNVEKLIDMARGSWILIFGDDDEIIEENIDPLMSILETSTSDTCFMIPALNMDSEKGSWLSELVPGVYPPIKMRSLILRNGISKFGFIGCHVFHRDLLVGSLKIPLYYSVHWIHLSYWWQHLILGGDYRFENLPLARLTNKYSTHARYKPQTWQKLWFQRIVNFYNISKLRRSSLAIWYLVFAREIISVSQFKEWLRFYAKNPRTAKLRLLAIQNEFLDKSSEQIAIRALFFLLFVVFAILKKLRFECLTRAH